jgi:hypothetical protein
MPRRQRSKTHPAASHPRPARRVYDESPDSFGTPGKPAEPAVCARCGSVLHAGRWTWNAAPDPAPAAKCPACLRIEQDQPDGILVIGGPFVASHRAEILGLIRHVEENEMQHHPLARTFGVDDDGDELRVRTTERRLADSLGRALERAYGGKLERTAGDRSSPLRLRWQRE